MNANNMTRMEAYAEIKNMGLQDACLKKFGKNYTMCKTADLIALIEGSKDSKEESPAAQHNGCVDVAARTAITRIAEILEEMGQFNEYEKEEILNILGRETTPVEDKPQSDSPYSDNEIDAMFEDMDI